MVNLKGRDILKMSDLTSEEVFYLLDLAADLKSKKKNGIPWLTIIPEKISH